MNPCDPVAEPSPDANHDFDFFFGRWRVRHRRLKQRLSNCTEWDEFEGASTAQPLLGGLGNIDDNLLDLPQGRYSAATLRDYDPKTRQWSIWWLDARMPGRIDAPMVGRFDAEGTGLFLADDLFEGRPIRVRFIWSLTRTPNPQWEQAFSPDGGASWETNWVMRFSRPD